MHLTEPYFCCILLTLAFTLEERARSISPSKTGPARTSAALAQPVTSTADAVLNPPIDFGAQSTPLSRSNAASGRASPTKAVDTDSSPISSTANRPDRASASPVTASGLARSGTLSWQQRPASRDGARPRPLSGAAPVRSPPQASLEPELRSEPSRKEIAASLAQKDPAWFKQTQDRGQGSAAYRKNQVEDTPSALTSRRTQLPGMTQSREPSKSPVPEEKPASQEADRFKRGTTPDIIALRNSMTEKPSYLRPNSRDLSVTGVKTADTSTEDERAADLARTSSILSQPRSPSPTKGLGGFVESAMMKRSDSVNKRWSVKANPGLKRGDSVLGGRPPSLHSRALSRDLPPARHDTSPSPLGSPRPASSHGRTDVTSPQSPTSKPLEKLPDTEDANKEGSSRPQTPVEDSHLARSPSKTMDPRRWSPTKSTWLESALQQKPEPQKPPALKEELPKWKLDLQRSKSLRASRDVSPDKTQSAPLEANANNGPTVSNTKAAEPTKDIKPAFPGWSTPAAVKPTQKSDAPTDHGSHQDRSLANEQRSEEKAEPLAEAQSSAKEDVKGPEVPRQAAEPPKKAPVIKPKPQTPPKTDFRSSLKSRAQEPAKAAEETLEFKSMFGKLKRTTTQNYVAPDELKNNILSGKAALNTTGGPVKTKRVDEFKESILAKKEEMKSAPAKSQTRPETKPKPEAPIPEALARRKTLSKASAPAHLASAPKPEAKPSMSADRSLVAVNLDSSHPASPQFTTLDSHTNKPQNGLASTEVTATIRKNKETNASTIGQNPKQTEKETKGQPESTPPATLKTAESEITARLDVKRAAAATPATAKPSRDATSSAVSSPPSTRLNQSSVQPVSMASASQSGTAGDLPPGSKLASRLNPNLAALLSRGNSPKPQSSPNASAVDVSTIRGAETSGKDEDSSALTHMTKGRAKGPKRRAPKAEAAPSQKPQADIVLPKASATAKPTPTLIPETSADSVASANSKTALPVTSPIPKVSQTQAQAAEPQKLRPGTSKNTSLQSSASSTPTAKPIIASKSPELRKASSSTPGTDDKIKPVVKPSTPRKPSWSPPQNTSTNTTQSGDARSSPDPRSQPLKIAATLASSTRSERDAKNEISNARGAAASTLMQGLGLNMSPPPQTKKMAPEPRVLTPPPDLASATTALMTSQRMQEILESYVGTISKDHEKAEFDAQQFLTANKSKEDKIKTNYFAIHEITGDGRKTPMPPHQEHILYEESMYLLVHNYSRDGGATSSEVHLWCGDRVSDAAVEDAQLFCRKDAREHNTKLEVVKQGKESASMIQALGGILITRRNKNSSLYMLCGRRYLGHIVFDEVENDSGSLCPGYAYLVSAPHGKLYLWKGKGAGIDEIGSARLISMDLGLTGEIEEVSQGQEPDSFWIGLGSTTKRSWNEDWHRRGDINGYPTALYRVEHERPGMLTNLASWGLKRAASPGKQQIKATCETIRSFTQSDLETPTIHILDTYRTLYVILTRQSAAKAAEFVTALFLAQDIAMLSPAVQDRPVLPACYVVAGDMTDDIKACFRKWSAAEGASLAGKESICVRLEDVIEALEL